MKSAHVYQRKGHWYFRPFSQTTAGVWVGAEDVLGVDGSSPVFEKGRAALDAVNASQESIPHPTDWGDLEDDALLQAAGVRSWSTFMKNASCVGIEVEQGTLTLTPERNLGPKEGFEPIPGKACTLPFPSPKEEIGAALESVFKQCK